MRDEKGQALILVLILLLIGGIIIAPILGYMATGLKAGRVHEERMLELYAADAGVEDAIWKLMNDRVPDTLPYSLTVNSMDVAVDIDSIWLLEGIEDPIGGQTPHAELVAVGRPIDLATGQYEVMITCDLTGTYERQGGIKVDRIGVWLPGDFDYVGPSSGITTDDPIPTDSRGGFAWIWDLSPPLHLPSKELTTKSLFFYIEPLGRDPSSDFAWVRTLSHDIYLAWDPNFTMSVIMSTASNPDTGQQTEVVAHVFTESGGAGIITWETSLK